MIINDGTITISVAEEKTIDSFIKKLEKFYKKYHQLQVAESLQTIANALTEYANVISPKYNLDYLQWKFVTVGSFEAIFIPSPQGIWINLRKMLRDSKVDFDKIAEYIYHEFVHFKQNILFKSNTGRDIDAEKDLYRKKGYFGSPWEQMAFAKQELEWVKRKVKKIHPSEVLKWIKKWGLSRSSTLNNLKQTNPEAYKRMLKYVVLFLLKQQAQKEIYTSDKNS